MKMYLLLETGDFPLPAMFSFRGNISEKNTPKKERCNPKGHRELQGQFCAHLSSYPSIKIWRYLWIYQKTHVVNSYQDIKVLLAKFE